MTAYLLQRLLLIPPTLIVLSLLAFTLAALAPGDPAEQYARRIHPGGDVTAADIAQARRELGLDHPFAVRYVNWLGAATRGQLGLSFATRTPVSSEIGTRAGATAELAATALLLAIGLAVPLGVTAALLRQHWLDHLLRTTSLTGASIPGFFLAYLLIALFAVRLHLLPVAGSEQPTSVILPALTLAVGPAATVSRLLRSSLLEVLGEDYVRSARAKGLSKMAATVRHALPNAAIPVVTVLGSILGHLLAGAVIVEFIFAWPGLGLLTVQAVFERDYPMIEGLVLFGGLLFLGINLLVDLSYRLFDPRVRLGT